MMVRSTGPVLVALACLVWGGSVTVFAQPAELLELMQAARSSNGEQAAEEEPAGDVRQADAGIQPLNENDRIRIHDDGRVELHVVNTPLATVLRMLSLQGERNIVATPAVSGAVTADLYDVTFDQALNAALVSNNCGYRIQNDFIFVYTSDELLDLQASETPSAPRVFRLNYVRTSDVLPVIEPLLSSTGKAAKSPDAVVGLETSATEAGGDQSPHQDYLVVYDFPDRLEAIEAVIRELDIKPQQVLVEATILRARLTDSNALGIDFSLVGGVDLDLLGAASNAIQDITLGQLPSERFEKFNSNASTSFTNNVPDGGFSLGIIKDHVAIFIRALEQITDTSVIANPKVLALNKQVANVIVGRRDGYITTTVTQTQAIQQVQFLETGTQLTFRPFIGTDGYVRMELHPEDSVGGLTAAQLPFEQTTEVTTNVIVKTGHSILIGGLFREVNSESRAQVPFIGEIPAIGDLFRSRSDSVDREEVIIILTVHIINNDDAFASLSQEAQEDIERSRVSLRRNALWTGRDRLAQRYYRNALELFGDGHESLALFNTNMALRSNPRFSSAIDLRERIRSEREWDEDGAIASDFVKTLILNDPPMSMESSGEQASQPTVDGNAGEVADGLE
jgi:type IV pilus assembly protein PilQ